MASTGSRAGFQCFNWGRIRFELRVRSVFGQGWGSGWCPGLQVHPKAEPQQDSTTIQIRCQQTVGGPADGRWPCRLCGPADYVALQIVGGPGDRCSGAVPPIRYCAVPGCTQCLCLCLCTLVTPDLRHSSHLDCVTQPRRKSEPMPEPNLSLCLSPRLSLGLRLSLYASCDYHSNVHKHQCDCNHNPDACPNPSPRVHSPDVGSV